MGRLLNVVLLLLAGIGWAAALRERDRYEEIKQRAANSLDQINRDLRGTRLRTAP